MSKFHCLIKIYGFIVPFPLKIKTNNSIYLLYPGDLVSELKSLEDYIYFNQNNIEQYSSFKEGDILKGQEYFTYIGFEIDLDDNLFENELINILWIKINPLIISLDYLLSNFHYFDSIFLFRENNSLYRIIKLNNLNPFWSKRRIHIHKNLIENIEELFSEILENVEKNDIYLDDFELFLRGKLYIEPRRLNLRKGKRNIFDSLSDLWESLEHISKIYWDFNKKKFQRIKKQDKNADNKVSKIVHMCNDLSYPLSTTDLDLIKRVYADFYNIKKHETSNLKKINVDQFSDDLLLIIPIIEKIFVILFGFFPDIITFRNIYKYYYMIEPVNKRQDLSSSSGIEARKNQLLREPKYFDFIRYIEFETIEEKITKYFRDPWSYDFSVKSLKKTASILNLSDFQIEFKVFDIERKDHDHISAFNEVYEFKGEYFSLRVMPYGRIKHDFSETSAELNFPISFIDFQLNN